MDTFTSPPSDGTASRGPRALNFFKRNWTWLLVVGLIGYLIYTVNPPIDLDARNDPAPAFALPTLDGSSYDLTAHTGEVVVLRFGPRGALPVARSGP